MTSNKENYLKVLLQLSSAVNIRSIDVANSMGVSKASVSHMMNILKNDGYISMEKYGTIMLTSKGLIAADKINKTYDVLKLFLINVLGIDDVIAAEDACRIEHVISTETLEKINLQISLTIKSKSNQQNW